MSQKKFYIRVRAEYVVYYEVEAKDISEAEHKASDLLHEDMNDPIYGSFDFEQFDPKDTLPYNTSDEDTDVNFSYDFHHDITRKQNES